MSCGRETRERDLMLSSSFFFFPPFPLRPLFDPFSFSLGQECHERGRRQLFAAFLSFPSFSPLLLLLVTVLLLSFGRYTERCGLVASIPLFF